MKRKKMMNEYIYRINKVLNYIQENIDGDLSLDNLSKIASFSPQVKPIQGFRVAYVRLQGYDAGVFSRKIESAFNKVRKWMNARELFDQNTKRIGIFYDHSNITSNESRRYDASFTVPQHIQSGSDGVDIQDIPEGKYAICRVEADHCDEE
jgi:DNA gyrase inhibitor GyrI